MELIEETLTGAVREGYRLLMRIRVELALPAGREQICGYYRRVGEACRAWAEEVTGERLRSAYLSLSSDRDRAAFRTARYRMRCAPSLERGQLVAWICDGVLEMDGRARRRRWAQLWNTEEELAYPAAQGLRLLVGEGRLPRPPFRPDGFYPTEGGILFFRNSTAEQAEEEWIHQNSDVED